VWPCFSAVLILTACGASPSMPTTPSVLKAPPSAPLSQYSLSGIVRVAGLPVADAKVALLKLDGLITSLVTDGSGSYRFPAVENVSFSGALVSVSKSEYFTDTKYILMSQDQKLDFDLERAAYIPVGQVIQGSIGEARCGSLGYGGNGGAACRRFALNVPASGALEVAVSSAGLPFDLTVLRPDGTIGVYGGASSSPARVTLQVAGGLTYQIDVVHISQAARDFELTTTLR